MKLLKGLCLGICFIMSQALFSACFNYSPGTSFWPMVNSIGNISKTIVGCVTPITAAEINAGGYTISAPGNYRLVEDVIATAGSVITITASDVYIDLNNFLITGNFTGSNIINIAGSHVTIVNGSLSGGASMPDNGIVIQSGHSNIKLAHLTVFNMANSPIQIANSTNNILIDAVSAYANEQAIIANGTQHLELNNCVVTSNNAGIFITNSSNVYITNCITTNCGTDGLVLDASAICFVKDYVSTGCSSGIRVLNGASDIEIDNAHIIAATVGINIESLVNDVTIRDCIVTDSAENGIFFADRNLNILVQDCDLISSGSCGLCAQDCGSMTVSGCTAQTNSGDGFNFVATFTNEEPPFHYGLLVDACLAARNQENGFHITSLPDPNSGIPSSYIASFRNNSAEQNGIPGQGCGFNLALSNGSTVIGNNATRSGLDNIRLYVTNGSTIIENRCTLPGSSSANYNALASSGNIYLGNYGLYLVATSATNYQVAPDVITTVAVTPGAPPTAANSTYWVNIDASS